MTQQWTDLHGKALEVGAEGKLSGGYADTAVPVYLVHEPVAIVGFGRTRVRVRLLRSEYASRQPVLVHPRSIVLTVHAPAQPAAQEPT